MNNPVFHKGSDRIYVFRRGVVFLRRSKYFFTLGEAEGKNFFTLGQGYIIFFSGIVGVGGYYFATHFSKEFPKSHFFYFRGFEAFYFSS